MSSNSTDECAPVVRVYEQEVIIVPTLLLFGFLVILLAVCLLRYCPQHRLSRTTAPGPPTRRDPEGDLQRPPDQRQQRKDRRRDIRGVDAPADFNILEHEAVPMTVQAPPPPAVAPPPAGGWHHGAFSQLTPLAQGLSIRRDNTTRYRARLDRTPVVLRVLRDSANSSEEEEFLGFTSFLSNLGPHPFLPALLGVVSAARPLIMESSSDELPCDLTEKTIFTMAGQVASALEHLHGRNCIHGNVRARSVLIGRDLTAKLWGLGPAYHRGRRPVWEQEDAEMRKWQAPEVLSGRAVTQSSDTWSFGILLFEMVTQGEAPFPDVLASDLLQQLQRGKTLRRPVSCSNALWSLIKSCCQWGPQQRPSLAQLIRKLSSGQKSANGRTVLRVPEPMDIEKYLREAGYGEAYNYAVL
ncbi:hypothetical protein NHX12_024320 [Muraenolepis orangiensis]|uniref:Protein kinase domain-containing protein n=1 Tax=Muraenolepis orangiensis TaxID=630683 RepID=A0A9Q0EM81_9TELE|nr:hypothetical protein NHX12_024320 [Muraenolepis orangiensis]